MGIAERRWREKEQRRNTIMDAAERVFFAKGAANATMDEVAEAAELSKGLLYFYFKNKNDLCHAIVHRGLRVLHQFFERAIRDHERGIDQVRAIGAAYIGFSREYPDYFNLMAWFEAERGNEADPETYEEACAEEGGECIELVARAVQNGIDDGTVRRDLDPLVTAVILWGQTHGIIQIARYKETKHQYRVDPEHMLHIALDFISRGLEPHEAALPLPETKA